MADDEWRYDAEDEADGTDRRDDFDGVDDAESDDSGEREWRFSVGDVGEDGVENGDEQGWLALDSVVEPGSVDPENALFVALGIASGLVVAVQFFL
jgi:hypothetical protein